MMKSSLLFVSVVITQFTSAVVKVVYMPDNNKAGGICIRCETWTKSYIGVRTVDGSVLCKHCSKA